jgi:orotate phosphoribosyltransferase
MTRTAAAFVEFLWECEALTFGDFVTKSGRPTPYFVDAGRIGSGARLRRLGEFYAEAIDERFGNGVDVLFGPAYKGIPLAVSTGIALADRGHDVGVCFDRKEAKDHGEGGSLVGHRPRAGERVVIVEDVTTAGTSVRQTVPVLHAIPGVEVVGLVVGVDRQERGSRPDRSALDELAHELGLATVALAGLDDIVTQLSDGRLAADDLARIDGHRRAYGVASTG